MSWDNCKVLVGTSSYLGPVDRSRECKNRAVGTVNGKPVCRFHFNQNQRLLVALAKELKVKR